MEREIFFGKKFLCQILIHLFLSDAKSAVRPAIVLFENYSYLFILLGGRRQKCLCIMTISLVLSDKNVYVVRRFSEMLSDENVKSVGDGICSGIRFCPRASTFLSDSIPGIDIKKREVKPLL